MAELKTRPNDASVEAFLNGIAQQTRRRDSHTVLEIMRRVTGCEPRMWGTNIVGFGTYHYTYKSGREGDWPITGFSPRKQALTVYIMPGFGDYGALMKRLGKHKSSVSCLYINKLEDVDLATLEELIRLAFKRMTDKYGHSDI